MRSVRDGAGGPSLMGPDPDWCPFSFLAPLPRQVRLPASASASARPGHTPNGGQGRTHGKCRSQPRAVSGPPSLLLAAQATRFRRAWLEESRGSSELSNCSPETARIPHRLLPSRRGLFTPRAPHGAGAVSSLPPRGRGARTHTSEDELQTPVLSCAQARNRLTRMCARAHTHGPT